MTSQANVVTSKVHDMAAQVNREVGPRVPQYANIVASRLIEFTRVTTPMFFDSKSEDDHQDFLDEVYNILHAMGVISIKKVELVAYKLKDAAQTLYVQ